MIILVLTTDQFNDSYFDGPEEMFRSQFLILLLAFDVNYQDFVSRLESLS